MPHTTSKGKHVYSVDLMFAYINIFKPEIHKINLDSVNYDVNAKGWVMVIFQLMMYYKIQKNIKMIMIE